MERKKKHKDIHLRNTLHYVVPLRIRADMRIRIDKHTPHTEHIKEGQGATRYILRAASAAVVAAGEGAASWWHWFQALGRL